MTAPRTLTRGQARLLAFTAGATCANLYYAQPLLPTIADSLHVSQTSASLLVTITQLSYGTGILLSRTFAGAVAQVAGWRGVYAVAAVLMAATTVTLYRQLPDLPPEIETGYAAQLRETLSLVRTQPVLRWRSLIGACGFGSFSAFWTTVSFLLARPPYSFNQLEIGLFALAGAAGALLSAFGGRHIDARPRLRWPATGVVQGTLLVSYALIAAGGAHLGWLALALLVTGAAFMDAAVQSSNLLGQSVIYGLLPQARSRITAVYMTTMFIGGAFGSWAAAHAYERWGWAGACVAAAAFPAIGLLCWLAAGPRERRLS